MVHACFRLAKCSCCDVAGHLVCLLLFGFFSFALAFGIVLWCGLVGFGIALFFCDGWFMVGGFIVV